MKKKDVAVAIIIVAALFVGIMLEPFLWAYLFKADSFTCNGIVCKYTKTMQNVSMYCYKNGVQVDCPNDTINQVEWK